MNALEWARSLSRTVKAEPPDDEHVADVVADLQAAERELRELRKALMSELTEPVDGAEYRISEGRKANRSYNTSGLLAAFGGFEMLPWLVARDVVRVSWQWTKLRRAADAQDVTLSVASHEIDDGDEALVGEVWETQWKVEPKS